MTTEILCYSMTGNTRSVCARVAEGLHSPCHEITAPMRGSGFFGLVRLGFATVAGLNTDVSAPEIDWVSADLAILGAPLWAGRVAVPMRCYLETAPPLPPRVALVMTSAAAGYPQKAFDAFARLTGREVIATLHVDEASLGTDPFDDRFSDFVTACAEASARVTA
jgi:hypothetical protein